MNKIVFLNNSGDCWGGVEKWILEVAEELDKRDHHVIIAARATSRLFNRAQRKGLNTKKIKKLGSATFLNFRRVFTFKKWLSNNDIDTVFMLSSPVFKFGTVTAKLAGVENIIYQRGSAIPIKDKFYNHWLLNWVTTFIAISKKTGKKALKYMSDFPETKVELIYHGVKIDKFKNPNLVSDLKEEFNIDADKRVLVNIGRLQKQKGQEDLIKAVAKIKKQSNDFVVLIVGDGPDKSNLENLVKELNLNEKIKFIGFREDIPSILKQSDFMIHTARQEGFGLVIAEAMAAGIPIVATDCGSIPELITPGINGYLAESENPSDISANILKMFNSNIEKMGYQAEQIAQKKFSFQRMVDQTEEIIL